MLCKNCNHNLSDGALFCPACGHKVVPEQSQPLQNGAFSRPGDLTAVPTPPKNPAANSVAPPAAPVPVAEPAPAVQPAPQPAPAADCPTCGSPVKPGIHFCSHCGSRIPQSAPGAQAPVSQPVPNPGFSAPGSGAQPRTPVSTPGKPPRPPRPTRPAEPIGKKPSTGILIGAIAAGVVVLGLLVWLIVSLIGNGPVLQIYNAAKKTLNADNFTVEFTIGADGEELDGTAQVAIDLKERDIVAYGEIESYDQSVSFAIYEGYWIYEGYYGYYGEDISDELDEIFDAYEDSVSQKDADLEDTMDDIWGRGTYDAFEEYVDPDLFLECIEDVIKDMNKKSWLEENAGYSVSKHNGMTLHTFEPSMYDLVYAILESTEKSFHDPDDFDDMVDDLEDTEDYIDDAEIELNIGIQSGKLTYLSLDYFFDYEYIYVEAEFSDIGKTEIDFDELEDMLDEIS